MKEETFKSLLIAVTDQAKLFARNYLLDELPVHNIYQIKFNSSFDDYTNQQFSYYPEDDDKVVSDINLESVIKLLLRNSKIPVWIDISVTGTKEDKTILTLLCAGRYSDQEEEFYYTQKGTGPFGIKSPALPPDFKEDSKFKLPDH